MHPMKSPYSNRLTLNIRCFLMNYLFSHCLKRVCYQKSDYLLEDSLKSGLIPCSNNCIRVHVVKNNEKWCDGLTGSTTARVSRPASTVHMLRTSERKTENGTNTANWLLYFSIDVLICLLTFWIITYWIIPCSITVFKYIYVKIIRNAEMMRWPYRVDDCKSFKASFYCAHVANIWEENRIRY